MKTKHIVYSALIAGMYVALTYVSASLGLANQTIQIRLGEALTVLPYFTPYAIWGLFAGCLISNILTGCVITDVIFGSVATLIGAVMTFRMSKIDIKGKKWLAPIGPILSNTIIVPFILTYAYGLKDAMWLMFITVGIGEILSCGVLGMILLTALDKHKQRLF